MLLTIWNFKIIKKNQKKKNIIEINNMTKMMKTKQKLEKINRIEMNVAEKLVEHTKNNSLQLLPSHNY